ncbi:MAG: hypothetical protein ACJ789_15915 [Thermomicrobiales bacterium]|jgi:hypothetical protein
MPSSSSCAHLNPDNELFALLDELDRLEELLEDMEELGVASREQAEARIAFLNLRVDALSTEEDVP